MEEEVSVLGRHSLRDPGYGSIQASQKEFTSLLSNSFHVVSDDDSDEESASEPPPKNIRYERSRIDKLKLIILPPLYFGFMVTAAVVAFFTIDALIVSYHHRVRSIQEVTVDHYNIIGIAMFPDSFTSFDFCKFMYADDLHPSNKNWTELQPPNQICTHTNVTFYSHLLKRNRTAMVFNGPTLVQNKQNLAIHFTIETTGDYSAMEYLLLGYWEQVLNQSAAQQAEYLSEMEQSRPLFTVPAGFRSWIKMSWTIYNRGSASRNFSDFAINCDLAAYNDPRNLSERTTSPLLVLFEWKGSTFEYVTDILSTNPWNTVGSLAGVFVTLIKVGEYANRWIKRMRRERRKKRIKAAEIEEQHQRTLDQYWRKRIERRLKELSKSKAIDGYHHHHIT